MRAMLCAAGLLGALSAPLAMACGHCVEDKMAAVYDHAVISQAKARHQHVAFIAIEGPLGADAKTRAAIAGVLRGVKGVDPKSVRVSLELASISYAFDPKRTSFASVQRAIGAPLSRMGLRTSEIAILDENARKL